jgi:hypothetical protein
LSFRTCLLAGRVDAESRKGRIMLRPYNNSPLQQAFYHTNQLYYVPPYLTKAQ